MEDLSSQPTPVNQPARPGRRPAKILAISILVLACVFFSWRVFNYYRQIQSGTLDPANLAFETTQVSASQLLEIAKSAPGSGELATTDDPSLGPDGAQLTVVQFADFGCPHSQTESYVVRALAKQYPEVKFIYRDFPLTEIHPGADLAAEAGECAGVQDKFWEYHDVLYRHAGEFTSEILIDYASQLDLDVPDFTACLESGVFTDEVAEDSSDGVVAGVEGTPTFFFNGQKIAGAIPYDDFVDLIEAFTAEQEPSP